MVVTETKILVDRTGHPQAQWLTLDSTGVASASPIAVDVTPAVTDGRLVYGEYGRVVDPFNPRTVGVVTGRVYDLARRESYAFDRYDKELTVCSLDSLSCSIKQVGATYSYQYQPILVRYGATGLGYAGASGLQFLDGYL